MKKIMALTMALTLMIGAILVAAPPTQAQTEHEDHCVCGGKAISVGDHTTCTPIAEWTEMTQALVDGLYTDDETDVIDLEGSYYLAENIQLPCPLSPKEGKTLTLCLNGKQLAGKDKGTMTDAQSVVCRAFTMKSGTLNITDCTNNPGSIWGKSTASGGTINVNVAGAALNLYAGTVNGNTVVGNGGTIYLNAGQFKMYGGKVQNGVAANSKSGGNIYLGSSMIMYGGTIAGGKAAAGGGNVYLGTSGASLTMKNGVVQNGQAKNGANICVTSGSLAIEDGLVQNGVATDRGGNIFVNGTAAITGGTVAGGSDSHAAGVHLNAGKSISTGTTTLDAVLDCGVYSAGTATLTMYSDALTLGVNASAALTLDRDLTVDLNGHTLGGTITTGTNKLYIADSTADAAGKAGSGKLNATVTGTIAQGQAVPASNLAGQRFVTIDGVAHRIYVGVTDVSLVLDGKNVGMGYTTGFKADESVAEKISEYGIEVYLKDGTPVVGSKEGSTFVAGTEGNKATAHVTGILKNGTDTEYLETEVCAKTYVVIDGTKIYSNEYAFSLKTIFAAMDAKAAQLDQAAKDLLAEIEGYYGADFYK